MSKGTKMSAGSMHEKLRKINEEFKARSCVGSGFVFNKNVRLESPINYFNKEEGGDTQKCLSESIDKSLGSLCINKGMGSLKKNSPERKETPSMGNRTMTFTKDASKKVILGMNLYKKPVVDAGKVAMVNHKNISEAASVNFKSGPGYVKSVVNSSIFNKGLVAGHISRQTTAREEPARNTPTHPSEAERGYSRDTLSISKSIFSNPLSNNRIYTAEGRSSQSVVNFKASAESAGQLSNTGQNQREGYSPSKSVMYTSTKYNSRAQSPTLAPINVMYIKSTSPKPSIIPQDFSNLTERSSADYSSDAQGFTSIPCLYAPGCRITTYPHIKISNTVLNYEDSVETTTYYITIESNVTWTVCKSIKEIISLAPTVQCTTLANAMSPQDRRIRDSIIQAMLNSKLDRKLQSFILSDISETSTFRSSYLLMNNGGWKAYLFKFVGKALICYEKNKVFKIFLLSGCEVSPIGIDGFSLRKSEEGIELHATCEKERDAWITDIREYVSRL